jgi:hypothetical protein
MRQRGDSDNEHGSSIVATILSMGFVCFAFLIVIVIYWTAVVMGFVRFPWG